ncbi:hypothetical protein FACS1894172_05430 [Spirochaetia bacterium]|nr:hypothetical protein FACS1894164_20740 [Spirochaetia bacterium]GHU31092.1 hypothetical protein FACS1894172_05430 [Spirochaetia bacterium]
MTIEQTVEVPPNRRLTIDVPRDIPAGPVILTFTPKAAAHLKTRDDDEAWKAMAADTEREKEAHEWCSAYFGPRT